MLSESCKLSALSDQHEGTCGTAALGCADVVPAASAGKAVHSTAVSAH